MKNKYAIGMAIISIAALATTALGGEGDERHQPSPCKDLPSHAQLQAALKSVVDVGGTNNSGFGLDMWATTVNRDGEVCAVAFTGKDRGEIGRASCRERG